MKPLFLLAAGVLCAQPRFERDVLPIFTAHCFSCHGGTAMAGLDLRTAASALRGSHEGLVLVKGSSEKSLLYEKVSKKLMPPDAFNLHLNAAQIATIKQWIDGGALSDEADAHAVRWAEQTKAFDAGPKAILAAKCAPCHLNDKPAAGLDLRTLASAVRGSANGPVIEEGVADKSILIRQIERGVMPPKGSARLTADEIRALRRWIDTSRFGAREAVAERTQFTGAEAPPITAEQKQWWSFQKPLKRPAPAVRAKDRVRTPIDAFILAKLEAKSLSLSPEAAPATLMRRAYYDLLGMPPTPKEVEEFAADTKPGAYERLIDKLLASKHYGERWGRHWLDSAGYVDAAGFDNCFPVVELHDGVWRYRDYVVNAFNNDKPYDRFLTEQLAGDELFDWRKASKYTPEMIEALTATGYLRSVYDRTDADIVNLIGERWDVVVNLMEKVSTNLMGLTVGCARCHTHRYDPIPQRDYYRMAAIFTPAFNPMKWTQPKHRFLPDVAKPEQEAIEKHNHEIDEQMKRVERERTKLRALYREKLLDTKLAALPEAFRADAREAVGVAAEKRTEVQKYLVGKFGRALAVGDDELKKTLSKDDEAADSKLGTQIDTLKSFRKNFEKIAALWDVGLAPNTRLLQRGQIESPGPRVTAGVPLVLSESFSPARDAAGETTGNRLAFARFLTSRDNPLTARVMVNRVWQQHFGRGIVETPENFGKMGALPTHPELLDWLSVEFMDQGWSLKKLHRLILTSSVYRQSSRGGSNAPDPENKLLSRMNLIRLDAEAVRDGVLAASGKLDLRIGGKPVMLKTRTDGLQDLVDDKHRRSIYIMSRRNHPFQFLQVFDFPSIQVNCNRRARSATPLQSLAMLNDDVLVAAARDLAARVKGDVPMAYKIALSRLPAANELQEAAAFVDKQTSIHTFANVPAEKARERAFEALCHALLASNEFLYVD